MKRRRFLKRLTAALGGLLAGGPRTGGAARGDDGQGAAKQDGRNEADAKGRLNYALPTLGGKQVWADQLHFHQWRIQHNIETGHCRLLDGDDVRRAWGTFDQCRAALDDVKKRDKLPPMKGRAVVVLHGLIRTRSSMDKICAHLHDKGGYEVFNVSYPSTRSDVATHAKNLARIVDGLEGIDQINFVASSLGNLVIRHYLADRTDDKTGKRPDARIKRIVMIAPPNQGSKLAERFQKQLLMKVVWGTPGQEIANWSKLEPKLATPQCEFGILAGGNGNGEKGRNPLLNGDDDLVLAVEETRLAGARDFATVPSAHTFLKDHPQTLEYTLRFLKDGHFVSDAKRQPIVVDKKP